MPAKSKHAKVTYVTHDTDTYSSYKNNDSDIHSCKTIPFENRAYYKCNNVTFLSPREHGIWKTNDIDSHPFKQSKHANHYMWNNHTDSVNMQKLHM